MGAPASDRTKWRSMTSFLKRPFTGVSGVTLVGDEDEDMQVGDDCEECTDEEMCAQDDGSLDAAACQFDKTISVLQDVLLDPSFEQIQNTFCQKHCHDFEDVEENKLSYTDTFHEYQAVVERNLEQRLSAAIPDFSMESFIQVLDRRRDEIMEEILDLLMSFVDFQAFKELMLAHKQEAANSALQVNVSQAVVHCEEQEEGDMRPDLDAELHVSRVKVC